jgi:hypothetical protein
MGAKNAAKSAAKVINLAVFNRTSPKKKAWDGEVSVGVLFESVIAPEESRPGDDFRCVDKG